MHLLERLKATFFSEVVVQKLLLKNWSNHGLLYSYIDETAVNFVELIFPGRNLGPILRPVNHLKNSSKDLSNEGLKFLLSLLEVGH